MHDAEFVGLLQGADHRDHELNRPLGRYRFAVHRFAKRHPLQVLEHHERAALVLVDVVNDDDVLVMASRGGARLYQEALGQAGDFAAHELDGHAAAQAQVAGQIDHAHTTPSELAG